MPTFGKQSHSKLVTCERDIQTVMIEAIKYFDFTILEGHRDIEKQHEYWQQGRALVSEGANPKHKDSWYITDKDKVITHIDGYEKKGRHNYEPSKAIDAIPWPIDWNNHIAFNALAALILSISADFLANGRISKPIRWGGHWKTFKDLPHYQI